MIQCPNNEFQDILQGVQVLPKIGCVPILNILPRSLAQNRGVKYLPELGRNSRRVSLSPAAALSSKRRRPTKPTIMNNDWDERDYNDFLILGFR